MSTERRAAVTDWRVTVRLTRGSRAAREYLDGELRGRLSSLAEVSLGKSALFAYAGTSEAAHAAAEIARQLTVGQQLDAEVTLERWHPVDGRWDDDSAFLGLTDEQVRDAEHEHRATEEARRSAETGVAQWTLRVTLPARRDSADLAKRLAIDGVTASRRGKTLWIGASNEDAARDLARHIAARAPAAALEVKRTTVSAPPPEVGPLA
jgi:hypothetical protein